MGAVILPSRLMRQPQYAAQIDRSSTIARGFVEVLTPLNAPRAVMGSNTKVSSAQGINGNPERAFTNVISGGTAGAVYIPVNPVTSNEWTFLVVANVGDMSGYNALIDFNSGANGLENRVSIQSAAFSSHNIGVDARPYKADYNSTTPLTPGPALLIATISAITNLMCLYYQGKLISSAAIDSTAPITISQIQLFSKGGSGNNYDSAAAGSTISMVGLANRAVSASEVQELFRNPWQLFKAPPQRIWATAASGASLVTPGTGSLALVGYSPAVARTANQSISPGAYALGITGYSPVVSQSSATAITPGAGAVAFAGFAPSVARTQNQALAPVAGTLALAGYAPTVAQIPVGVISPSTGGLAISGYAPTVLRTASLSLSVPGGALSIASYAPMVTQTVPILTIRYRIIEAKQDYNTDTVHFK